MYYNLDAIFFFSRGLLSTPFAHSHRCYQIAIHPRPYNGQYAINLPIRKILFKISFARLPVTDVSLNTNRHILRHFAQLERYLQDPSASIRMARDCGQQYLSEKIIQFNINGKL